ncbi:single-stranded DNA-binding protein [Nocardioides sp.]|uniref:single-stranded DNA-binding protein n=1 Tax=Nocardioides sp. TaxID=35761 RepID=UPI003510FBCE
MTHDPVLTLQGRIGGDVVLRRAGDHPVATFRVAVTPRRLQRSTGTWTDLETQWYSVSAWRGLAENCAASLRRGDPVLVHGRLTVHTYTTKAGVQAQEWRIEAVTVGPDLTRGATTWRPAAARGPEPLGAAAPADEDGPDDGPDHGAEAAGEPSAA